MTDKNFIEEILQKGRQAKEKVQQEFTSLSFDQLNWKPTPESWSIAQCLDHLIASHNAYFRVLEKIKAGSYKMNLWEKYSPFTAICGRIMKDQLQEQVKRKMKAPGKIRPAASALSPQIVEKYLDNLTIFLKYISDCQRVDIDKTVITSPLIGIVTYNLRDAFQFLLQHEHRHINQAIRVKKNENFR
jgi:uncharacterized damage-inducible protein DinB